MTFDEEIKIWLDYVATQSYLNNDKTLLSIPEKIVFEINHIDFPILKAYWGISHNIKILSFEEFKNLMLDKWCDIIKFRKYYIKN